MQLTTPITARIVAKLTGRLGEVGLVRSFFGTQSNGGPDVWEQALDTAVGDTFSVPDIASLEKGYLYIVPASGSGSTNMKMMVYTNNAGAAGTLLATSSSTLVSASGWAEFSFAGQLLVPGSYHIVAVSSAVGGTGWDIGSVANGAVPSARTYTSFSYAAPPASAPAPATTANSDLAVYITYTY